MKGAGGSGISRPVKMLGVSFAFFAVYTLIHVWLNVTNNGSTPWDWSSLSGSGKSWAEISAPITIGLCTSLLILSFGMFLHHGTHVITFGYPGAFFNGFLIFIASITLVQIAGHTEIYVNVCDQDANPCKLNPLIKIGSGLSFIASWAGLLWLESFQNRVYNNLREQLPINESLRISEQNFAKMVTVLSLFLTFLKYLFLYFSSEDQVKYTIPWFVLATEGFLAYFVIIHYLKEPKTST